MQIFFLLHFITTFFPATFFFSENGEKSSGEKMKKNLKNNALKIQF